MIEAFLRFFKSPPGKILMFVAVVLVLFGLIGKRKMTTPKKGESGSKLPTVAGSMGGIRGDENVPHDIVSVANEAFRPFRPATPETPPKPVNQSETEGFIRPAKLVLSYDAEIRIPKISEPAKKVEQVVPPGLLIPCRLFSGIESNLSETPLIAMTLTDVRLNGQLIIPKGSEVHGTVRSDDHRKRVFTGSAWQVVTPAKKWFRMTGMGLNREYDPRHDLFGRGDGLAGLEGREVRMDQEATKGLFAANALSSSGRLAQQQNRTVFGNESVSSLGNGALAGASAVMDRYAEMKLKEIADNKPFIRVSAGTEFYVYTQASVIVKDPEEEKPEVNAALLQRQKLMKELQSQLQKSSGGEPR